jgi:hypothetical protein
MKKTTLLTLTGMFLALSASGAIRYDSRTYQDPPNEVANMTVSAWINGDQCDVRFVQSGNPFMAEGTRLVCREGAKKIFLVNDKDKTFSEWDLNAVLESVGNVMESMGGVMKMSVENAKVETLLKEDGGLVAGYPTTHYRFRTTYDLTMKIMGMGQTQHTETIQDGWYTTAIDDVALGVWLMRDPPDFGDSGLGSLIELEKSKAKGWPLRTVIEQVSQDKKGRKQATKTITEVTDIGEGTPPPGTFGWGSDYQQVNMMPDLSGMQADQGDEKDDGKKKGGLRGLFKKGGGG